jgi:hypothetical protein
MAVTTDWENGKIFWKNHVRILPGDKLRSEIVCSFPRPFQVNHGTRTMYIQRQAMGISNAEPSVLLPEISTQRSLQHLTF